MERLLHRALVAGARIVLLFLTIFSLQTIPFVSSAPPLPVSGAGYATVNGTLYVQGGAYTVTNFTSAFSSLSLKTPWNNTSPPWESISIGNHFPVANVLQGLAVTPDKTRLVFWGSFNPPQNGTLVIYNILNNTWSTLTLAPGAIPTGNGISVVIDPTTPGGGLGNLYAPDGCTGLGGAPGLCILTSDQKTIGIVPMPGGLVPVGVIMYSFVYCTSRKTMMLYGGVTSNNLSNPNLYEYSAITSIWSLLLPQGTPPGDIQRHCMVETTDGSKMLVFGGMNTSQQASSRLFILYINNLTWIEGPDVGSANARVNHVCATNGDSFIVWGGAAFQNGIQVTANDTPLIYNIPNNTWVQNFEVAPPPSPSTKVTSTTTGPTPSPSSDVAPPPPIEKSSNLGAIIGGAVGVFVVIAAIGIFLYKRSKSAGNGDRHPSQSKRSGDGKVANFGKKGGFLNGGNNVEDMNDKDPYGDYPGTHAVQLQETLARHTGDPYLPSSSQSLQHLQEFQSSSEPQPPLFQHFPPRPEMHTRNTILSSRSSPRDFTSGNDTMDNNRFSGVGSSPPPLLPFQPRQSVMSLSPSGSPQWEEGSLGASPADLYAQSIYHGASNNTHVPLGSFPTDAYGQQIFFDVGKNVSSAGSPQGSLNSVPVESHGQSTYYDGRSRMLSGPVKCPDSRLTSTLYSNSPQYTPVGSDGQGVRLDIRSPQHVGPGHENSPAAWMAAAGTRNSFGNPQAVIPQWSESSGEIGSGGSYYPPPPGQQLPVQPESDLMQKRLKLLKAQHELDLEKMRLEQEAQMQTVQKQLLQGSG